MKSLIKPVGLVALTGLLIFLGTQLLFTQEATPIRPTRPPRTQDTTLRISTDSLTAQETYVAKVIISAPWAKKNLVYDGEESLPGEFGVYQYVVPESLKDQVDAGLPEGPTSFTVAPNGDIYITDPLNKRIQRFDANGNFVSVIPIPPLEKSKYLHIQDIPELSDSARAESLRRAGKLPRDGKVPPKPKTTNWYQYVWSSICVDRSNNIYLLWWGDYTKQTLCKYDQEGKLLATYPLLDERERLAWTGLYCDKKSNQYDSARNITDKLPSKITGSFLGADEKGRIYTKSFTYDTKYNTTTFIRKFDDKGNLISTIVWDTVFGSSWGSGYWRGAREIVDTEGNIYVYYSTKDGITITKWYKQP